MRMRKIIVIHDAKAIRRVLDTYIVSELNDSVVFECSSPVEALKELNEKEYDVIICGKSMKEMDGIDVFKAVCKTQVNEKTPFIIVTSTGSKQNLEEIVNSGIEHFLVSPFIPLELREMINKVCDPRKWRVVDRISIPDTKAIIHSTKGDVAGKMINMSLNGILCEIDCTQPYVDLLTSTHITVQFPLRFENAEIEVLWCKLFRVHVLDWDTKYYPQCIPTRMRVVWQVEKIADEHKEIFSKINEKLRNDYHMIQSSRDNS